MPGQLQPKPKPLTLADLTPEEYRLLGTSPNLNGTMLVRLRALRAAILTGERTEYIVTPRLAFARWLYRHGRIDG